MEKKYQVFISSTFQDLVEERLDASKAVLDLGHIPAGMEAFPATDSDQMRYIEQIIDQCDYYVIIVAGRYGSMDDSGVSYTQLEFRYALNKKIPVLAFLFDDINQLPNSKCEPDADKKSKLEDFRAELSKGRLIKKWNSKDDLKTKLTASLAVSFAQNPQAGWVRATSVANEQILEKTIKLQEENKLLTDLNAKLKEKPEYKNLNLAALNEEIELTFYYRSVNHGRQKIFVQYKFSWSEIITMVGPDTFKPTPPRHLKDKIEYYVRNKKRLDYEIDLLLESWDVIKIQLIALGFLESAQEKNLNGVMEEYLTITESGQKVLMEIMTVRTSL